MNSERITFGVFGQETAITARRLGFNNDGTTPSFRVPKEVGEGVIYHSKPYGRENIVIANAVLQGENEQKHYIRTFDGMDPTEMDSLPKEEASKQYELFLGELMKVVNPEFQVTVGQLRDRLERLSEDI